MSLQLITPPAEEPVSLESAKAHCRVDVNDDDALLTGLIVAARQLAEHLTGRALITQQWKLSLDCFPIAAIHAPHPPLQTVESIEYIDQTGATQTLADAAYRVHTSALEGLIVPAYGTRWPAARNDIGSVSIVLNVGYGAAADVPQAIKQWMLLCIGTWYGSREQILTGTVVSELPRGVWDALLDPYRVWRME